MAGDGSGTTTRVARLRARARPRRAAAGGTALAVAAPLALAAVLGAGHAPHRLDQTAGTAWVVSPGQGLATLIDGTSRDVVVSVAVPGAGHALEVAQGRAGAYLVDQDVGTVGRLDAATFAAGTPVALGTPGGGLTVLQNAPADGAAGVVHVLDPQARTATRVDPRTLAVHDEVTLSARPAPGQAVVDDAGDLWAVDPATSTLTRVEAGGRGASTGASDDDARTVRRTDAATATARLVLVRGAAVLVDPARGAVHRVGADARPGPARCLDTRPADDVRVLGSVTRDEVYVAVDQAGSLLVAPTDGDGCGRAVDLVDAAADAGDPEYGDLAQSGRYVFVPDRTTGTTAVVDTTAGEVLDHVALATPGHRVELHAQDAFVFFNDLDGETAGVLTLGAGRWTAHALAKYDPTTGEGAEVLVPEGERPPVQGLAPQASGDDEAATPPGAAAPPRAPDARPGAAAPPRGPAAAGRPPGEVGGAAGPGAPSASPSALPTSSATPSPSAPPGPAPQLTVTLGTDPASPGQPEYQPYTSATVVADVGGAGPDATWDWQVVGGSSDPPTWSPPAPGQPLVLDSVGGSDVTVRLTVTDGAASRTAELLLWVKYVCHLTIDGSGGEHALDLGASGSGTFTVEAHECRAPQAVTVAGPGWLTVEPASLTVPADGSSVTVTVTQRAAGTGTGSVGVTHAASDQTSVVAVTPDAPPQVLDATVCRTTEPLREDGRTVGTRVTTVVEAVVLDAWWSGGALPPHTVTGDDGRPLGHVGTGGSGEHVYRATETVDIRLDDPAPPTPATPPTRVSATDPFGATGTRTTRDLGC